MKVFGTGHRPNSFLLNISDYDLARDYILDILNKTIHTQDFIVDEIYSGMALGFDMILAECAVLHNIPLVACIPYVGQEYKWPPKFQNQYRYLIAHSSRIETAQTITPKTYIDFSKANHLRDKSLVENGDIGIGFKNPKVTNGGTAVTFEYAKKAKKDIINIWDEYVNYPDREIPIKLDFK